MTRPPTGNEREREVFVWVKLLVALYELFYLQTEQQTEEGDGLEWAPYYLSICDMRRNV